MSFAKSSVLLALAACASVVSAHGYVSLITIDGTEYQGYPPSSAPYENPAVSRIAWAETATDNGYVAPDAYASGDIICHRGATNANLTATAAAGASVSVQWNTWPDSHKGPVINYMASCGDDCSTVDKTTLEWFKINEAGLIDGSTSPGTYASDNLISNNYTQTFTIPSTLKAGNYVVRHEIIALHSAEQEDGAQNYPQCFNVAVTGSGTELPSGTLGTALYSEDDAGILVNIYQTLSTYEIPGPTVAFSDDSSAAAATTAAAAAATTAATTKASSASAAAATSSAKTSTTAAAATTSKAATTTAAAATTTKAAAATTQTSAAAAATTKASCKKRRSHARDVARQ